MNIHTALKAYGLSDKESQVYLFLLKNSDVTAVTISKETDIAKTTVYEILEKLNKQSLINVWKKNNVKYYGAESPKQFLRQLEAKKNLIDQALPEMLAVRAVREDQPEVKMYTGKEGVIIALEDQLKYFENNKIDTYYSYSHYDLIDFLPTYFPKWLERREALKVKAQIILPKTMEEKLPPLYIQNKYREMRFLKTTKPFEGWFQIYGDTIMSVGIKEDNVHAIIIKSESITNMFKFFHQQVWELLGPADLSKVHVE